MVASKGEGGKEEDGDLRLQLFLGRAAPVPESTAPPPHRRVGRGQESKLGRFVFTSKAFGRPFAVVSFGLPIWFPDSTVLPAPCR